MRHTARLLATVSVIALAAVGAADLRPANAQTGPLRAGDVATDPSVRIRAETALLYANTLDRLTQIIERDIAADPGVGVITGLRSGQLSALPSLDPELSDLISSLRIGARVMDADPDPDRTDERAIVFVAEGDLRSGVTRSEIESAARDARLRAVARLQGRQIQGQDGAFEIPTGMSGLPDAAVATYVGVRGRDLVTSSGAGSEGFRTLTCPDGQFGTGVIERQDLGRVTTLGGSVAETGAGWTEVSRSCVPEYAQTIRIMDSCVAADGSTGTAVFEVTQNVRRDPADPFGTQIFTDPGSRAQVDDGGCVVGFRDDEALNLLVEGAVAGRRELELKTRTASSDVGSGVNRVPRVVAGEPGAGGPVSGIPFLATSVSDFEFIRTCAQELGPIPLPTGSVNPSGTGTGAWSGPSTFTGDVSWHRDYNRRETAFSDDLFAYILNYDLVLDPNPYGWPAKGRQRVPTTHGPAPDGDGWYRTGLLCERTLARPETQVAVRDCETGYPVFPLGTYEETRNGSGTYEEGYGAAPALQSISWAGWLETANACYNQTVTRTEETRTVRTSTGSRTCDQPQRRVRVDTTNTFQRGGSDITTAYDPNWTDDGAATNCVTQSSGGGDGGGERDFIDVDSDGWGDFSTVSEAQAAGFTGNYGISGNFDTVSNYNRSDGVQGQVDYSNDQRTGSGSGGTGDGCFAPGTCVLMADGTETRIEEVRVGDVVAGGGRVYMTGLFLACDLYRLDGVEVTGGHLVRGDAGWGPVREHPAAVRVLTGERLVHNLATTRNRVRAGGLLFADYAEISGPLIDDLLAAAAQERTLPLTA